MAGWLALILLVLAGIAIVLRSDAGLIPGFSGFGGFSAAEIAAAAFALAVAIVITAPLLRRYQDRLGLMGRDLLVWSGVAVGILALYAYRADLPQIADLMVGTLAPKGAAVDVPAPVETERMVRLKRQSTGHFVARTLINGGALELVVDTGATTIVLKPSDAEQVGIDISKLNYSVPVETANGSAFAAPVKLKTVLVGPVGLAGVDALVAMPGVLDQSLLGMSFLSRLKSYEFSGDFLTLRG